MAKKSFTDNPAEQFISSFQEEKTIEQVSPAIANVNTIPEGYKLDPRYIEKKSKRVNLLMQPSLYEKIQAKAKAEKKSVNDFIHSCMEDFLR